MFFPDVQDVFDTLFGFQLYSFAKHYGSTLALKLTKNCSKEFQKPAVFAEGFKNQNTFCID